MIPYRFPGPNLLSAFRAFTITRTAPWEFQRQPVNTWRWCMECGTTLTRCFGFVHAGDFLTKAYPRERCAQCVERHAG